MNLLQACNISGRDAVSCLIDGLGDRTLQNGAKAGRYTAPEELYSEFLSLLGTDRTDSKNEPSNVEKEKSTKFDKKRLGPKMNSKPTSTSSRSVKCYNWHAVGHIATNCPKPKVECRNCNLLGHDTSKCRKTKSSKQGSRSEVKIVDSTKANQECYFVECKVNDVLVQGFIDTGCSIVTIRETTATQLNLKLSISTQ
ncbi:hypothetical protein Zmor_005281 [Zophobas morio]|uniref:CCHC-type domain-containing protein n=1 Tax=Zophobas morio TaxID=2755281 RepID=A0AA38IV20_9CUCU|nr:hypothetical protein Zmor_005281 [Zophobas morio]